MSGTSAYDPETGIRVLIKPSQSSFFAGEPFSVSITFINTRIPPEQPQPSIPSSHFLDPSLGLINGGSKPPTPGPTSSSFSRPYSHSISSSQSALPSPTFRNANGNGVSTDSVTNVTTKRFHHRRGAHSISSAPLARPPTSPGIPRSPVVMNTPIFCITSKELRRTLDRRGIGRRTKANEEGHDWYWLWDKKPWTLALNSWLDASATVTGIDVNIKVATPVEDTSGANGLSTETRASSQSAASTSDITAAPTLPELIEQRRKRQLGKSLSVTVAPPPRNEFEYGAYQASSSSTPQSASFINGELKRTHTLALSKSHPHARKDSLVLDGSNTASFLDGASPPTPQTSTPTTSSFPGAFPLSSIAENSPQGSLFSSNRSSAGQPSLPSTPILGVPYMESGPSTPAPGTSFHHARNGVGLGHPSSSSSAYRPNDTGEELVLYSYAQLIGQVVITPPVPHNSSATIQPTREQRAAMYSLREKLLKKGKGGVVGGGSMDINSMLGLSSPGSGKSYSPRTPSSAVPSAMARASSDGQRHTRTASLSGSLFALLSPSSLMGFGDSETQDEGRAQEESLRTAPPGAGWTESDVKRSRGLGLGLGLTNGQQLSQRPSPPVPPPLVKSHSHDHSSSLQHGRKSSIGAFFGLSNADPAEVPPSSAPASRARGSGFLALGSSSHTGPNEREEVEDESAKFEYTSIAPLPTLETQPAMLAVDLRLRPGEEKSYTYTLSLPDNLPPTFRGKSLKFSYELIVGLCRAGPGNSKHNISKLMKVPIRLYNCVRVDRPLKVYHLIWPLHKRMDMAMPVSQAKVIDGPLVPSESVFSTKERSPPGMVGSLKEIRDYAQRLVGSLPDVSADIRGERVDGRNVDKDLEARVRRQELIRDDEDEEEPAIGCREAVELLTRTPKKASYDVTKEGVKVAVLTLSKNSFRLGESVSGVVELNERSSRARVLQLSAFLEAHESLPSTISPPASNKHLKRTYAEHYSSMLINTVRTTFSLDIPSDASPTFQTGVGKTATPGIPQHEDHPGGVEWKLRLNLHVAVASEYADLGTEGVRMKALARDGTRGEWSSSWKALNVVKPLQKVGPAPTAMSPRMKSPHNSPYGQGRSGSRTTSNSSWSAFFASYIMPSAEEKQYHDGDELEDEEDEKMSQSTNSLTGSRAGTRTSVDSSTYASSNPSVTGLGPGSSEPEVYDGVKPDFAGGVGVGVDFEGGKVGWTEVRVETVECEVPLRVWPGNTAFRALDVVFEV
ncbi:Rgp1-domain-containing protein [Coprinopsis sp. MPI-PUGE-AT-0042]|nr:Rgp1-domain-containing protein [Coprinopsis sp. MPI-PUGE-AT-0042]